MKQLLDDFMYTRGRLEGGFVILNGWPVYVERVKENFTADVVYKANVMKADVKDFTYDFNLGYNKAGDAFYMRNPARQWKQSLRNTCVYGVRNGGGPVMSPDLNRLASLLKGGYEWRGRNENHAFHKDWAIRNGTLFFRAKRVGTVDEGLDQKHFYLAEALREAGFQ